MRWLTGAVFMVCLTFMAICTIESSNWLGDLAAVVGWALGFTILIIASAAMDLLVKYRKALGRKL
jgi:hypothetical protein